MSDATVTAIGWLCITALVLGMAACTYGTTKSRDEMALARENACWDRGGRWETTGWSGAWCDISPTEEKAPR